MALQNAAKLNLHQWDRHKCGDVHWSEELFMLMDRSVANVKSGKSAV